MPESDHATAKPSDTMSRTLMWHGGLQTLLGLLSGFGPLFFPGLAGNPHLIGVVQGGMLFGVAGGWHLLRASPRALTVIKYTLLIGLYGNWAGAQLKAIEELRSIADAVQTTSFLPLVSCIMVLLASRRVPTSSTG
jgi:hypothetical protein